MILDEATSALDPKSEVEVQGAILNISEKEKGRLTIIMIAHRLQTIESAQNLIYLQSSSEVLAGEKGTPEYENLIQKLKSTSYAHQTQEDPNQDVEQ